MANLSKTTRDHEQIRRWAEERGGKPSHVKSTGSGEDIGILRIDFPGYGSQGSLEPISWEEWFEKFDEKNLALLYEEETAAGQRSNFNKIVSAETAEENEERAGRSRKGGKSSSRSRSGQRGGSSSAKKSARSGGSSKSAAKSASKKTASRGSSKKTGGATKKAGTSAKKSASTASRRSGASKTAGRAGQAKKRSTAKKSSGKHR